MHQRIGFARVGVLLLCMAVNTTCFSPSPEVHAAPRIGDGPRVRQPLLMSSYGASDDMSSAQKKQEQRMEMASIKGAKAIAELDVQERTKRAMLAEAVEDRIFELVDELELLVAKNGGLDELAEDVKEEAVAMAKETKSLQVQYDDLVSGRPSHLLNLSLD